MAENILERLCNEKHSEIKEKLKIQDERLDRHDVDINQLKQNSAVFDTKLDQITKSLNNLTKALWGLASAIGLALFGFLLQAIAKTVFKT